VVNLQIPIVLEPILILLGIAAIIPIIEAITRTAKAEKARDILAIAAFAASMYSLIQLYQTVMTSGAQKYVFAMFGPDRGGIEIYVDIYSVYFGLIFCGIGLMVAIYSFRYMEVDTGLDKYYALLLILVAGLIGVAFAGDFFNLFVFWEMMCISSYTLVTFRKYRWEPVEAGFKYLVMSTLGSLLVLYGISMLYGLVGSLNFAALRTFMLTEGANTNPFTLYFIMGTIIAGFGVTAAIVPLHTWLPDAHPAAPSSISAMLSGVVIKAGIYSMSRGLFTIFSPSVFDYGTILMIFGVATISIANIMALMQRDIKRLLAYSSIVNIGYILTGLGIGGYVLAHYYKVAPEAAMAVVVFAIGGALFHVLNHAIGKGLLFLCSGCFVHEAGTRDIAELEGIGKKMMFSGTSFTIGLLALAGVPPLSGFWSKLFIILAGFSIPEDGFLKLISIIMVINSIFAASYYLWLLQRIVLKTPKPAAEKAVEAPFTMVLPVVLLAIACVVIGIWPGAFIRIATEATKVLLGGL
jgi:multicomponent Na+:H+ antiporter subunit D